MTTRAEKAESSDIPGCKCIYRAAEQGAKECAIVGLIVWECNKCWCIVWHCLCIGAWKSILSVLRLVAV